MRASTMFTISAAGLVLAAVATAGIFLGYNNERWIVAMGVLVGVTAIISGAILNSFGLLKNDLWGKKD